MLHFLCLNFLISPSRANNSYIHGMRPAVHLGKHLFCVFIWEGTNHSLLHFVLLVPRFMWKPGEQLSHQTVSHTSSQVFVLLKVRFTRYALTIRYSEFQFLKNLAALSYRSFKGFSLQGRSGKIQAPSWTPQELLFCRAGYSREGRLVRVYKDSLCLVSSFLASYWPLP